MAKQTHHNPDALLTVQRLSVSSAQVKNVVNNISFQIVKGERLALIGPNGCGKSTLLNAIVNPAGVKGRIYLAGRELNSYSKTERARHIALLTQHDEADPRLTVEDYIALGRIPHHACCSAAHNRYLVSQVIDETGISALRNKHLGCLSGGERQKAALARVFAQTPALLLLDEPTNHLDPFARTNLLNMVRQKGIATLAVLHDLPLVEPFANRVMVMQAGNMVICDTPDRALSKTIMRPVFGMDSHTVNHPVTGSSIRIFEAPQCT